MFNEQYASGYKNAAARPQLNYMKMFSGQVMCKGIWQIIFNRNEFLDGLEILNFIFDAVDNTPEGYMVISLTVEYLNVRNNSWLIVFNQHLEVNQDIQ